MKWKAYLRSWEGTRLENQWMRIFSALLLGIVLVMSVLLFRKEQVVVVQPFTLAEEAWVAKGQASQSYQEAWGMALSMLLGNVTPKNIDYIKSSLEPILASDIYHEVIDALEIQAQDIRKERITMRFEQRAAVYEKGTVFIEGISFVKGLAGREKSSPRTYEFRFNVKDYRLELAYLNTYEGQARTEDVLEKEAERSKKSGGRS